MGKAQAQELHLHHMVDGNKELESQLPRNVTDLSTIPGLIKKFKRWIRIGVYILLVLTGQAAATLLGRSYYDKGGNSKWLVAIVQLAGFPLMIPFLFFSPSINSTTSPINPNQPSILIQASVYLGLGLLLAATALLYAVGLLYLQVSTYSLLCASQLAFNALFSFLINSQKFTPFIVNSLILLTVSSILLVFQPDSSILVGVSKAKHALGFICTIGGSASFGLVVALTQFSLRRILNKDTYKAVLGMIIYRPLVATIAGVVGLFASGEWKGITTEMEEFSLGQVSYVMTLLWIAICWQIYAIGSNCLINEVSSLFANISSAVGLPVILVFAVIFFDDKMDGIKGIAMVLAVWGFVSYVYQEYLDDAKSKSTITTTAVDASPAGNI